MEQTDKNNYINALKEWAETIVEKPSKEMDNCDRVFHVDGVPFEIHLKPYATLEDLHRIITFVEEYLERYETLTFCKRNDKENQ